jgi:hypothetical protein
MVMGMLHAGGLDVVTDGVRVADTSNPRGYYEDERVKTLASDDDRTWLRGARGKAVKIISFLLGNLPETNNYRVIFMHRDLQEVMASQRTMLAATKTPVDPATDARAAQEFEHHLQKVRLLLHSRRCFEVLDVGYSDVVENPRQQAERIARFVHVPLDLTRMAAMVDGELYRHRSSTNGRA